MHLDAKDREVDGRGNCVFTVTTNFPCDSSVGIENEIEAASPPSLNPTLHTFKSPLSD